MSKISFNSRLLKAILTRENIEEIKREIFDTEKSIPFELLKLGYNYSIWHDREPRTYYKRADWLHIAAYCNDSRVEQFVEEVFLSEVRFKGDCLIVLWLKNPKRAQHWLNMIHEYDPLFNSLNNYQKTKLVKKLLMKFNCKEDELFSNIFLSDQDNKMEKLEKSVQKVLLTQEKLRAQLVSKNGRYPHNYNSIVREITKQRDLVISSEALTEEQADRIFDALWETNVKLV
ncbi:MAG: hypothetical protein ACTSV5_13775, partial [Promethearchaeota archaeon]